MTTAVLRVLALAALLAARTQALSNGVDGYYDGADGRYTKLDRFLHDRMGLAGGGGGTGDRSEPPALAADRGLSSWTAAVPEDEDDDGEDDDDDADPDEDDVDAADQEPPPPPPPQMTTSGRVYQQQQQQQQPIRLRHRNQLQHSADNNALQFDHNIQNHEPTRTMSPISENKWKLLGSRKAVEETMRSSHRISLVQGNNEAGEAYKHQIRMSKEASCKIPRTRVIKVTDVYPSSNKIYMPSCTVLHVCAEDTGCCSSPTLKCGPKSSQPIYLHFLVYMAPGLEDQHSPEQSSYHKSLLFYNHTECECQSRMDDMMPRDTLSTSMEVPIDPQPVQRRTDKHFSCKCPTEYTVRYLANGSCSCDCFDKQRECIRYKKGNIYFNHIDRHCLASGQCLLPTCEYGVYSARTGRCPKKFETLYSFKKKHYF